MNAVTPFIADFHLSSTTLERIIQGVQAQGVANALPTAAQRQAAFAEYQKFGREIVLPDARLRWSCGQVHVASRQMSALDSSGGIVHLGSIEVPQENPMLTVAGCRIATFGDAQGQYAHMVDQLCPQFPSPPKSRVAALTTAFQNCGIVLTIPDGMMLDAPIQFIWTYAEGSAAAVFPKVFLSLGRGSRATVIERHVGGGDTFLCGVTQIFTAEEARLDYVVIQQTSDNARIHMIRTAQAQARSNVNWYFAELGAGMLQAQQEMCLAGVGASSNIAIMSIRTGMERIDVRTRIDQRAEQTSVKSIWRAALGERGRVFLGDQLRIRKRAAQSASHIAHDALLFSRKAQVHIEPKRSAKNHHIRVHQRVAIGTLDEEALFYLLTRGIPQSEAMHMIALAFFEPAISQFPLRFQEEIRLALDDRIDALTLFSE